MPHLRPLRRRCGEQASCSHHDHCGDTKKHKLPFHPCFSFGLGTRFLVPIERVRESSATVTPTSPNLPVWVARGAFFMSKLPSSLLALAQGRPGAEGLGWLWKGREARHA